MPYCYTYHKMYIAPRYKHEAIKCVCGMRETHSGPQRLLELSVQSTWAAAAWHLGQSLSVHIGLEPT